jgi:hypothetical protein
MFSMVASGQARNKKAPDGQALFYHAERKLRGKRKLS